MSDQPGNTPKSVDHRSRYATAGLALLGLGGQPLLFGDLGSLRVFCALSLVLFGIVMFVRAIKPEIFLVDGREERHYKKSTNLFEIVQIPPKTRWGVWMAAVVLCLCVSLLAAFVHRQFFGNEQSQPIISISEIRKIVREELLAFLPNYNPKSTPQVFPQPPLNRPSPSPRTKPELAYGNLADRAKKLSEKMLWDVMLCIGPRASNPRPYQLCSDVFIEQDATELVKIRDELALFHFRDRQLDEDIDSMRVVINLNRDIPPIEVQDAASRLKALADTVPSNMKEETK